MSTSVSTVTLSDSTTLAESVAYFSAGSVTIPDFLSWLLAHPHPMADSVVLMSVVDSATFAQVITAWSSAAVSKAVAQVARPLGQITAKISKKGAISVYGLQHMPVTLYPATWERFLKDQSCDVEKSSILKLCSTTDEVEYTLADYIFEDKAGKKVAKDSDLEYAKSLPSLVDSHRIVLLPGTTLTASQLIEEYTRQAMQFAKDPGALSDVFTKCKGVIVKVKPSRKA